MQYDRELFEQLWLYRQVYHLRRAYDRQTVLTIAEAIAHGERLLRRPPEPTVRVGFGHR